MKKICLAGWMLIRLVAGVATGFLDSKPGQMIADFMQAGADIMSAMVKNQPRGCRSQCR